MKKIFTLLFFLASLIIKAQPVLNSSEMLTFGSIIQERYISNLNVVDTTLQGPNQTWDFTAFVASGDPDLFSTTIDPANTPYAASFPNSNYAYVETPTVAYRYFNLTSTKFERVGSYVTTLNTYSDPQIEYVYPLQLGTTNQDTWASTASSFGGTYNITCLGTGTLILPSGSFTSLMVRVDIDETIVAFSAFFWYDANNGAPLLARVYGDGLFIADVGYYMTSLSSGIPENNILSNIKYNNPVTTQLQLSYQSKSQKEIQYHIVNTMGQFIGSGTLDGNSNYKEVDFAALSSGIYFIEFKTEGEARSFKIKIVKQ